MDDQERVRSPQKYSLSQEILRIPPKKVMHFNFGEPVTRENFASFIVWQFGVSRGIMPAQQMACEYVEHQTGFDYRNTYRSFFNAGGFASLSSEEQEKIEAALKRVKKHRSVGVADEFPGNLESDLYQLALDGVPVIPEYILGGEKLSRAEFLKQLDEVVRREQEKK